ncbi:hypothetical protein HanRHA438_Chr17g0835741 [Helianthus annuus]|nr:hypothetical protein HanRHA438_Chr17g0835741 [Helianthus annuus]
MQITHDSNKFYTLNMTCPHLGRPRQSRDRPSGSLGSRDTPSQVVLSQVVLSGPTGGWFVHQVPHVGWI